MTDCINIFLNILSSQEMEGSEILHQLQFVQQESIFIMLRAVEKPQVVEVDLSEKAGWGEGRSCWGREFPCLSFSFISLVGRPQVTTDLGMCVQIFKERKLKDRCIGAAEAHGSHEKYMNSVQVLGLFFYQTFHP